MHNQLLSFLSGMVFVVKYTNILLIFSFLIGFLFELLLETCLDRV